MTKVSITIKEGKVTWLSQSGEPLPEEQWVELNLAIARVFDERN